METKPREDETTGGLIHDWQRPRDPDLPYPYIDWNPFTGQAQKYVRSEQKGKFHVQTRSADLQANIDANKRDQNEGRQRFKVDGMTFERVASIPLHLVELWKKQHGVDIFNKDHAKAVARLLNDPDLRYLKTTPKQI